MTKFYHKQEDNRHCFLETTVDKHEYLEIGEKKIKYRFINWYQTEEFTELGYYVYKKLLDNAIKNI